jgi:hypothetical protein
VVSLPPSLPEQRSAFMRYRGQGHEIAVELPVREFLAEAFDVSVVTIDNWKIRYPEFLGAQRWMFIPRSGDLTTVVLPSVDAPATGRLGHHFMFGSRGVERYPPGPPSSFLSWYLGQIRAGKILRVRTIDESPRSQSSSSDIPATSLQPSRRD